jgi:hypothetical protein
MGTLAVLKALVGYRDPLPPEETLQDFLLRLKNINHHGDDLNDEL